MSFNTFGKLFRFTTWGESHGPAIGCVVDGCPPRIKISEKDIQKELKRENLVNLNLLLKEKKMIKLKFCREYLMVRQLVHQYLSLIHI